MSKKLTVIIPFLNEGMEVAHTVASIRQYAADRVEILVINDASNHLYDYEEMLKPYSATYLRNEERLGIAACRDLGVSLIQTPYFLPTEGLNQALQTAALGGVDVRLMLPKRSDTRSANMASHSFIDEMVKAGVKVYLYKPGFLHSKLVVSDDALTSIGSANMDFRSFEHNFEINAFVYQKEFALQMKRIFTHDMHHCERLIPSRWLKRPLKQRMAESFMRLFSPLL